MQVNQTLTNWQELEADANRESNDNEDDAYRIGRRDGFSEAVQLIDQMTGGDGEYRYCLGLEDSERHCPDPDMMIARIVARTKEPSRG